jgi:predicted permease
MSSLRLDLRYAFRSWRADPVCAAIIILTLGLGVSVNLVVFGLVEGLVLRPLPAVSDFPRLATTARNPLSFQAWRMFAGRQRSFEAVAAWQTSTVSLLADGGAEATNAAFVSGRYFAVLGIGPSRGRLLSTTDEVIAERPAAVISQQCWHSHFGAASDVVGRTVVVDRTAVTIVGVAAAGFRGTDLGEPIDVFLPVTAWDVVRGASGRQAWLTDPGRCWLRAIGRLAVGVSPAAARAETDLLVAALAREIPSYRETTLDWVPLVDAAFPGVARAGVRQVLKTLVVVAACVLLVACANVASLLLVRGERRRSELGIRSALGASRLRLVVQLLTETLLLVVLASAVAALLARWTLAILSSVRLTAHVPIALTGALDLRVAGGAALAAVATTLACGLLPAWRGAGASVDTHLARGIGGAERRGGVLLRDVLLAMQVAVSVVLVSGAALFTRTLLDLEALPPGFEPGGVAMMRLNVHLAGYGPEAGLDFYRRLQQRVAGLAGVLQVARALNEPLCEPVYVRSIGLPGEPAESQVANTVVTPGYFGVLGIRVIEGREFDDLAPAGSIVVNETLARRLWPGRNPVGRTVEARDHGSPMSRVIGVVRDTKYESLREAATSFAYTQAADDYAPAQVLFARTAGDEGRLLAAMRQAARALDGGVPVITQATLREHVASTLAEPRAAAGLVTALAGLALALAAAGLYGTLSFVVSLRRRDVAVRLALGAGARQVLASLLGRTGLAVGAGLSAGTCVAALAWRFVTGLPSSADPAVSLAAAAITMGVAAGAAAGPARRAIVTAPAEALRE